MIGVMGRRRRRRFEEKTTGDESTGNSSPGDMMVESDIDVGIKTAFCIF